MKRKDLRARVYTCKTPEGSVRGTARQLVEKLTALAKDARNNKDDTLAENYMQHAEHYGRIGED